MSDSRALVLVKAREAVRALVANSRALAREGGSAHALSPFRATMELDSVAYALDETAFRAVLAEEVPAADRARLLSGMGDLASSSMLAADPEDAVQAMLAMAEGDAELGVSVSTGRISAFTLHTILACANYMCARGDWEKMLDVVVDTASGVERTLRHWIVAAVWYEAGCPPSVGTEVAHGLFEPIDELTAGVFDEVGLGHDEGLELMAEMLREELMPEFDRDEFAAARERFCAAQERVREEAVAARQARDVAKKAAEDLDV